MTEDELKTQYPDHDVARLFEMSDDGLSECLAAAHMIYRNVKFIAPHPVREREATVREIIMLRLAFLRRAKMREGGWYVSSAGSPTPFGGI